VEASEIIKIVQANLDSAGFCADKDWEFNSGGNGINPCEAYAALKGLAIEINAAAGEDVISFEYNEEEMKQIYRDFCYPVDDEDEDDE
jgi:hypothetical protein